MLGLLLLLLMQLLAPMLAGAAVLLLPSAAARALDELLLLELVLGPLPRGCAVGDNSTRLAKRVETSTAPFDSDGRRVRCAGGEADGRDTPSSVAVAGGCGCSGAVDAAAAAPSCEVLC